MDKELVEMLSKDWEDCFFAVSLDAVLGFFETNGYKIVKQRDWEGLIDMSLDKIRKVLQEHLDSKEKK